MININITIINENGEKFLYAKYFSPSDVGFSKYNIKDTIPMIKNLKESLLEKAINDSNTIILTSVVSEDNHEEYNSIGMREMARLFSDNFPGMNIIYSATQPQENKQ